MLANMYHGKKKEMGMGGMNMPKLMKKSMPGGGMVSPMEREMGMGGRMEMGHGGDMERAVKIYLMKKGGKTAFPDLTGDGKVTFADILKGRLRKGKKKSQAYGGKVMRKGGEVEYGLGGAIMGGINALREGKGLGGAAMAAGKGFVTPGSGIAQGAKLAGGLLAGSQNPALAGIGKVAGMASNFLPGGGGPAGAIGQLMQMRKAEMGMMVPRK